MMQLPLLLPPASPRHPHPDFAPANRQVQSPGNGARGQQPPEASGGFPFDAVLVDVLAAAPAVSIQGDVAEPGESLGKADDGGTALVTAADPVPGQAGVLPFPAAVAPFAAALVPASTVTSGATMWLPAAAAAGSAGPDAASAAAPIAEGQRAAADAAAAVPDVKGSPAGRQGSDPATGDAAQAISATEGTPAARQGPGIGHAPGIGQASGNSTFTATPQDGGAASSATSGPLSSATSGPLSSTTSGAGALLFAGAESDVPGHSASGEAPPAPTYAAPPVHAAPAAPLPATATAQPAPSHPAGFTDPGRLTPQLAGPLFSLASAAPGEHVMTLKVSPEDLGPVTVRAHIDASGVRIELFAPGDAGRDALRTILPELRRGLAESGLGTSLDLSDQSSPPDTGGEPWQDPGSRERGQPQPTVAAPAEPIRAARRPAVVLPGNPHGSLDILA
ncbi:Flagellar hook-length control protein fliK [Arthrobacter sp. 9AX]|uniref:flagellar hook-length control protein FliK n=1 Tax=Arthrobacter sp. 9AX TaxID=2653131 RepID=UPI0012F35603|nr:flagellar hook-length control protein FliK [Arthrobacter sp. 9AX]VXB80757.1 Flagellar hook-length control protein fliK [Arthrobacter sp. 9AX]